MRETVVTLLDRRCRVCGDEGARLSACAYHPQHWTCSACRCPACVRGEPGDMLGPNHRHAAQGEMFR